MMGVTKAFLAGLLLAASGFAEQALSVGVIVGTPFTNVVNSTTPDLVSTSTNVTAGPAVRLNLPAGLRLEVDALYRPFSFSELNNRNTAVANVSASQWRFPVLLQYRFGGFSILRPFVGVGASFDHLSGLSSAASNITSGPGTLLQQTHAGVVLGGGVDVKIPLVRVSAELRYTHEGSADFQSLSNLNQAEFLVGVHF
jgi:hypothetical protein